MKKVIKFINTIILILLIFILIVVSYSKFVKQEELITLFGKGFLVVITDSMKPSIKSEELIVISEKDDYKNGDIVTYKDKTGMIVTHRIVSSSDKNFIAKGDNNNIADDMCSKNNIYGKVVFHSKILGMFVLYYLKPCVIIYVIYMIITEIYWLMKRNTIAVKNETETNKENNENEEKICDQKEEKI